MWPLIAAIVGMALQKQQANKQHAFAEQQQLDDTKAAIASKRAARSGDSGYAQIAAGGADYPSMPHGNAGPLVQVASALAENQATADKQAQAESDMFDDPNSRAPGLIGGSYNRSRGYW
jgi:hypothetical protein